MLDILLNPCPYETHIEGAGNAIIAKELNSDKRRSLFARAAKATKSDGALAIVQLAHPGARVPAVLNATPYSASDVEIPMSPREGAFGKPIPLTAEQIKREVVERFAYAAKYLKDAGFDGIQLQGCHEYIFNQFWSLKYNKRTDSYGGSLRNRMRLITETYEAIRKVVPAETGFVVGIKLNSSDFNSDRHEPTEGLAIVEALDRMGFDFIEFFGGTNEQVNDIANGVVKRESTIMRDAFYSKFSKDIRIRVSNAKLFLCGGFRTVPGMVSVIKAEGADGVSIARPATAEPDIPRKILKRGYQSVLRSPYEYDFMAGFMASMTQMYQMGGTTMAQAAGDPCYRIMDLTDDRTVKLYERELKEHMERLARSAAVVPIVFEYTV
ncbi:Protein T10B5.8 [Aphelenchoides avenae]|nr:Protein T10B5.8 [Aphelenchus avenae]